MSEFAVDDVTTPFLTSHRRSDSTWLQSTLKGDECTPLPYRSVDAKSETSVVRESTKTKKIYFAIFSYFVFGRVCQRVKQ